MLKYLIELRQRLLFLFCIFAVAFLTCYYFSNELFTYIISPLLEALPYHTQIIATQITTPVLLPIQLAADIALFLTIPFVLWQLWQFIIPALYPNERVNIRNLVLLSVFLFVLGLVFCFYMILPFMFQLFVRTIPPHVTMMPDINHSLAFISRTLLLFGMCFQVPIICLLLVQIEWMDVVALQRYRPYAIVLAFILGMLLTPPDLLSQIMLAIPLCMLYEFGILLAKHLCRTHQKHQERNKSY